MENPYYAGAHLTDDDCEVRILFSLIEAVVLKQTQLISFCRET